MMKHVKKNTANVVMTYVNECLHDTRSSVSITDVYAVWCTPSQ